MSSALLRTTQRVLKKQRELLFNAQNVRFESVCAAVLEEFGTPLKIQETKLKKLKPNEVRVCVHHCAVNKSDIDIITRRHDYKPSLPFVPGFEISGKILELGKEAKNSNFKVGDNIIGLNKEQCGGFASQCNLPLADCYQAPVGIKSKEACALLDGYTKSILALVRRGRITEGDTVLITAAAGGLGLAAVDLAANVYKAKVIAVCSTEDRAAIVREKGAFAALKYEQDLIKEVENITDNKGVSLVFDSVGGEILENAIRCVSLEGRVVLASNALRNTSNIPFKEMLPKSVSITAVSLWKYRKASLEIYHNTMEDVIDMAEQELIVPYVSKTFDLEDVNDALAYIADGQCSGKVVLEMD